LKAQAPHDTSGIMTKNAYILTEILARIIMVYVAAFFVFEMAHSLLQQEKLSTLVFMLKEVLWLAFVLVRRPAIALSNSPADWLVALLASWATLLVRPGDSIENEWITAVQCLGILVTTAGMISLNVSFGIVPANRGIKSGGMYRFIRHPFYAGYCISYVAFFANHPTLNNAIIFSACFVLMLSRIQREERFLSRDPRYRELQKKTRWRLVPYIL